MGMAQNKKQSVELGLKHHKEDILKADSIRAYRDVAEAVLDDGQDYTLLEAEDKINQFLKGKVN